MLFIRLCLIITKVMNKNKQATFYYKNLSLGLIKKCFAYFSNQISESVALFLIHCLVLVNAISGLSARSKAMIVGRLGHYKNQAFSLIKCQAIKPQPKTSKSPPSGVIGPKNLRLIGQ